VNAAHTHRHATAGRTDAEDKTTGLLNVGKKKEKISWRHIPVYMWCFNPSLLSILKHFCPDFSEGIYGWANLWAFSDLSI